MTSPLAGSYSLRYALALLGAWAVAASLAGAPAPRHPERRLEVEPATYERMLRAFNRGTMLLQGGGAWHARPHLLEATGLVPGEPAAWANLALCDLAAGELYQAGTELARAAALAPDHAGIRFLLGQHAARLERRSEALSQFRRAIQLDPGNARFRFELARELERKPEPAGQEEQAAQLDAILRLAPGNLVALLERAQLALKRAEWELWAATTRRMLVQSRDWPVEARRRLREAGEAGRRRDAGGARTRMLVTRNLLRGTEPYVRSFLALCGGSPWSPAPLERFMRLPAPQPRFAALDLGLEFLPRSEASGPNSWSKSIFLDPIGPEPSGGEPSPAATGVLSYADERLIESCAGTPRELCRRGWAGPWLAESVASLDWNNDFRPDLAVVDARGLHLFERDRARRWRETTARVDLPVEVRSRSWIRVWAADLEPDGRMDLVLGPPLQGEPLVLRNEGSRRWVARRPFRDIPGANALAWADLDGDGFSDLALRDGALRLVVLGNGADGRLHHWPVPAELGPVRGFCPADVNHDGRLDLVGFFVDGVIRRLSWNARAAGEEHACFVEALGRWRDWPGVYWANLIWADLDNNGAGDLVASAPGVAAPRGRVWLGDVQGRLQPIPRALDALIYSAADLNGDGRLDLIGAGPRGPVRLLNRGQRRYHWLGVQTRTYKWVHETQHLNSFALGGTVLIRAGRIGAAQSAAEPQLHFGLGEETAVDGMLARWPTGHHPTLDSYAPGIDRDSWIAPHVYW